MKRNVKRESELRELASTLCGYCAKRPIDLGVTRRGSGLGVRQNGKKIGPTSLRLPRPNLPKVIFFSRDGVGGHPEREKEKKKKKKKGHSKMYFMRRVDAQIRWFSDATRDGQPIRGDAQYVTKKVHRGSQPGGDDVVTRV